MSCLYVSEISPLPVASFANKRAGAGVHGGGVDAEQA